MKEFGKVAPRLPSNQHHGQRRRIEKHAAYAASIAPAPRTALFLVSFTPPPIRVTYLWLTIEGCVEICAFG